MHSHLGYVNQGDIIICLCRWNTLNCLPTPRCHAGLVECRGKLYLAGGSTFPLDSPTVCSLASILRYDELEDRCVVDKWEWGCVSGKEGVLSNAVYSGRFSLSPQKRCSGLYPQM